MTMLTSPFNNTFLKSCGFKIKNLARSFMSNSFFKYYMFIYNMHCFSNDIRSQAVFTYSIFQEIGLKIKCLTSGSQLNSIAK